MKICYNLEVRYCGAYVIGVRCERVLLVHHFSLTTTKPAKTLRLRAARTSMIAGQSRRLEVDLIGRVIWVGVPYGVGGLGR